MPRLPQATAPDPVLEPEKQFKPLPAVKLRVAVTPPSLLKLLPTSARSEYRPASHKLENQSILTGIDVHSGFTLALIPGSSINLLLNSAQHVLIALNIPQHLG